MVGAGADPVEAGYVKSLARPGGNVTGVTNLNRGLGGKRLELLKETVHRTAKALPLKLLSLELRNLEDLDSAFARSKSERAQALITTLSGQIATQQRQVLDFAAKNRLPAMYPYSEFVEAGG